MTTQPVAPMREEPPLAPQQQQGRRQRGGPQDCRLVIRDVARVLLYPIFLLNFAVVGLGCCIAAPCWCWYCKRKQELWHTTDEYVPMQEDAAAAAEFGEGEGPQSPPPTMSRGMSLDPLGPPPPPAPAHTTATATATATSPSHQRQQGQQGQGRPAPTPMPAVLRGFGANRVDLARVRYFNFYLPAARMDRVRLAVDVWLPPGASADARVGCILHQARYYRSFKLWGPPFYARGGKPLPMINDPYFSRFLVEGLAIVSMDVRGSGASFGGNRGPWMPEETADSLDLLDWVVKQPWSNGRVGLWGISYEGTRALLTGIAGHPAVTAVCPMYIFLDIYRDVGFIGGLHLSGFIKSWETITRMLDRNRLPDIFMPWLAWFSIDGVQPVTHEADGSPIDRPAAVLRAALREHRDNWSSTKDGEDLEYEDDVSPYNNLSAADLSPYARVDKWLQRLREQGDGRGTAAQGPTASTSLPPPPSFFLVSGWFDSTASCAIKLARHLRDAGVPDVTLLIGPWNHAGVQHARFFPDAATGFRRFNAPDEVAAWFKARLAPSSPAPQGGNGSSSNQGQSPVSPQQQEGKKRETELPACRYFVMQEERWKTPADGRFPAPGPTDTRAFPLVAGAERHGRLLLSASPEEGPPAAAGRMTLPVHLHKARVAKGVSRYRAMSHVMLPMEYRFESRDPRMRHLHFTSPPLTAPMEVTGFPRATLWVSSSAVDASLFLYLLCVDDRGVSHYITEGMLRVSSRKLQAPSTSPSTSVQDWPGLPHHSFRRADAQFLEPGGAPVEVQVNFHPTSYQFQRGQAIRLSVAGANPKDFLPLRFPHGGASYDLTVHTVPEHPSTLFLPTHGGGGWGAGVRKG